MSSVPGPAQPGRVSARSQKCPHMRKAGHFPPASKRPDLLDAGDPGRERRALAGRALRRGELGAQCSRRGSSDAQPLPARASGLGAGRPVHAGVRALASRSGLIDNHQCAGIGLNRPQAVRGPSRTVRETVREITGAYRHERPASDQAAAFTRAFESSPESPGSANATGVLKAEPPALSAGAEGCRPWRALPFSISVHMPSTVHPLCFAQH